MRARLPTLPGSAARHRLASQAIALLLLAALAFSFWPRRASLRRFDPAEVARIETAMWRQYYQKEYAGLFRNLYDLSRVQYHFSPWDSARLSWYAAQAARRFQPSRTRAEAAQALPLLEQYYRIVRRGSGERFDPSEAARLELDWWQLRREQAAPEKYGAVIGEVMAQLYRAPSADVRRSSILRAEMMHYRDQRSKKGLQSTDWERIRMGLEISYRLLKAEVGPKEIQRAANAIGE